LLFLWSFFLCCAGGGPPFPSLFFWDALRARISLPYDSRPHPSVERRQPAIPNLFFFLAKGGHPLSYPIRGGLPPFPLHQRLIAFAPTSAFCAPADSKPFSLLTRPFPLLLLKVKNSHLVSFLLLLVPADTHADSSSVRFFDVSV